MSLLDADKRRYVSTYWRYPSPRHSNDSNDDTGDEHETANPKDRNAGLDRREFLRLMGASTALASFTGCRRPVENRHFSAIQARLVKILTIC